MVKSLNKKGKLAVIHACGNDPGNQIIKKIWPKKNHFPRYINQFWNILKEILTKIY